MFYAYERSILQDGLLLVQQSRTCETRTGEKRIAFQIVVLEYIGETLRGKSYFGVRSRCDVWAEWTDGGRRRLISTNSTNISLGSRDEGRKEGGRDGAK